ncbi:hypothetical protein SLS62_006725 [Diatrype stigma]|uniref:Uncharacterized protein n=1 Tax=Diatrype stigma TaxID=117547 RepID=A0AAN9UY07_9PEZI
MGSDFISPPSLLWQPGMRVLKTKLRIDKEAMNAKSTLKIYVSQRSPQLISLTETRDLLPWRVEEDEQESEGLVAALDLEFDRGLFSAALRKLTCEYKLGELSRVYVNIEEDIGESMARHIWDGGLVTAGFLADSCRTKDKGFYIREYLPIDRESPNVLEIGCGVGMLGITIASVLRRAIEQQGFEPALPTVLLTDLPDAEARATSNISRFSLRTGSPQVQYENLDWDEGKKSQFGPLVKSRFWDLIVLSDCTYNIDAFPSLVGTLSALHGLNVTNADPEEKERNGVMTKVLLSTKPRHESEAAIFALLEADGWTCRLKKSIPLPRINSEGEVVEIYSVEKRTGSGPAAQSSSKKRKSTAAVVGDDMSQPSKKSSSKASA